MNYVEAGKPVKGKITLTKGKQEDEVVNLSAIYMRNGQKQMVDIRANIQLTGKEVEFVWDTAGVVLDSELFLSVKLMLTVGKGGHGQTQWKAIPVVLYRRTIEILAVDESDKPVAGAACRLRIHVEEGFESSGPSWREGYTVTRRGEKEWVHKTGDDGKVTFTNLPVGAISIDWVPPYALNPLGWKAVGEYTETGWKRKAEIRKIPIAHYVWWGDPTREDLLVSATKTPNDVAQLTETMMVHRGTGYTFYQAPKVVVMYWLQESANTLKARLDGNVFQQPVTNLSELMSEDGMAIHGVFMGRSKQLDAIIDTLSRYKMFSAVKDLVSLCVVYKYGGYYFDTTTMAPKDIVGFPDKLSAEQTDEIRFPATKTGAEYKFMRHLNNQFATLSAQTGILPDSNKWFTSGLDVWAMYAPPRHEALAMMIDSYIRRCAAFGLDNYPNETPLDFTTADGKSMCPYNGQSFDTFVKDTCKPTVNNDPATQFRNTLIGNLIIASVQEGLTTYAYELQNKPLPADKTLTPETAKFLWKTSNPPPDVAGDHVQAYLPNLGIPKAHSGSWRVQTAQAGEGAGH